MGYPKRTPTIIDGMARRRFLQPWKWPPAERLASSNAVIGARSFLVFCDISILGLPRTWMVNVENIDGIRIPIAVVSQVFGAINEGREATREIDRDLMGNTQLP
jgi:hypothetical protein